MSTRVMRTWSLKIFLQYAEWKENQKLSNLPFSHRPQCKLFPPKPPPPHQKKKKKKNPCLFVLISWDDCNTQEKLKKKIIQNLGGGGGGEGSESWTLI